MFDFDAFRGVPLSREPFDHLVVPGFLAPEGLRGARGGFPKIARAGLFPLSALSYGPSFAQLIEAIQGPELEAAFSEKFGLDLAGYPMMVTVRGHCRSKDGRVHTDTETKVVTALLYLNETWHGRGGRLRLLRGPGDLNDMIAEVPPDGGTLIAFRRSENSWHGHQPFEGERRYVMFNWMTTADAAARELARHRASARIKRLVPFA